MQSIVHEVLLDGIRHAFQDASDVLDHLRGCILSQNALGSHLRKCGSAFFSTFVRSLSRNFRNDRAAAIWVISIDNVNACGVGHRASNGPYVALWLLEAVILRDGSKY
jgi:hypothetical protein